MSPNPFPFRRNDWPTIGVEVEVQLVDAETMALRDAFPLVHSALSPELQTEVKPELMTSYLEINTGVCRTVADVEADLSRKVIAVERAAERHGVRIHWGATHPFSPWSEQIITDSPRYHLLVELMQETARRLVTFGLHVHIGLDTGDKAIMVCDRILRHLPAMLALTANTPFWSGRDTGLDSQRVKVMEGLPTAGLPPLMRNWSEYVWLLRQMVQTGFIRTKREIWWDVRPHAEFGTIEVRICDMPGDLPSVLAVAALTQCLVHQLSQEIDEGIYQFNCHPMMVRQNKWRACRSGMEAELVDPYTQETKPARAVIQALADHLQVTAKELDCSRYLDHVFQMTEEPSPAQRQRAFLRESGNWADVVRRSIERSRLNRD